MNEITRVHIAKVAYDIEVTAKKQLEKYLKSLESYTHDQDVLEDIEIRITELLTERGVEAGGVVSVDDVTAIRKQLGEPHEFADEATDIAAGSISSSGRRLYRDMDQAVLGGVMSGFASYFGINPVWLRLIFLALVFVSFGFAFIAYVILWATVPPARTAAEKLQLTGRPVTLESIRELNESEGSARPNQAAAIIRRVLAIGMGVVSSVIAAGIAFSAVGTVIATMLVDKSMPDFILGIASLSPDQTWLGWLAYWIFVTGLLLLASLFAIIATAFFKRSLTKRMIASGVVVIVLGIASMITVAGIVGSHSWRVSSEAQSAVRETKVNLPSEFSSVEAVVFEIPKLTGGGGDSRYEYRNANSSIQYIVSEGAPRYEFSALPAAKPKIRLDGATAYISLVIPEDRRNAFVSPMLTVYGPALKSLTVDAMNISYSGTTQESLEVTSKNSTAVSISGNFDTMVINGVGDVDVSSSSIQSLTVNSGQGLRVQAGTLRNLTATQPDVCPGGLRYSVDNVISLSGVSSGVMTYNGKEVAAENLKTACAAIDFEESLENYIR